MSRTFTTGVLSQGGFDPITVSFINRMPSKPVSDQQKNINIFIKEIKDLLPKYQQLFLFGAHGADINGCLVNIINNGINCSIGAAGLTLDGYWGINNEATGYLDTNFNPSIHGSQFAQNDAGFDIYLSNNVSPSSAWACGVKATNYVGFQLNTEAFAVNQAATLTRANVPFRAGLHSFNRTASNAISSQNQNLVNTAGANSSTARPNANVHLFNCNGLTAYYTGGICAYGIRSSLTDAEQLRMNNAINDFQIRSLIIKYGSSSWGVRMAKSYFLTLHNFDKYEAWEVYEFIKRMQPDYADGSTTGYYYNTFGPSGQNKQVADYIMLFKAGGNISAGGMEKTGATLRWDRDGNILNVNVAPAYTRGSNLGIITGTSTDGWNGVYSFYMTNTERSVNSYYGNCPVFLGKLKTGGSRLNIFYLFYNRWKVDMRGRPFAELTKGFQFQLSDYPGYLKFNISDIIGGVYSTLVGCLGSRYNPETSVQGDVTALTTEIQSEGTSYFILSQDNAIAGSLRNIRFTNDKVNRLDFWNTSITEGLSVWSKNIYQLRLDGCNLSVSAVDSQLSVVDNYFSGSVVPIKSLTLNISGGTNGIPTGGQNNVNRLSIIAKHVAAGWVATINVNS